MSDIINSINYSTKNEKLKYIDLQFDKEFYNEITPDRLRQFYFQAYSQCQKMIQDNSLKAYTSFPKGIAQENICFIVKKAAKQRVDDMFIAMGAKRDKKRKVDILNLIPGLKISIGYSLGNNRFYINLIQIDKNSNDVQFAPFIDYILVHQYRMFPAKQKDNDYYKQMRGEYNFYQMLNNYDKSDAALFSEKTNEQKIQPNQKYSTIKKEVQSQLIYADEISDSDTGALRNIIIELENEVASYKNELIKIKIDFFNEKIKKHNAKTHLYKYQICDLQKRLCNFETGNSIDFSENSSSDKLDQSFEQINQYEQQLFQQEQNQQHQSYFEENGELEE